VRRAAAGRIALLLATLGIAAGARADLELRDGWVAQPPPGAMATAGYGVLANTGGEPVELVGFTSPHCDSVELHRTSYRGDVARMEEVSRLRLPAGDTLRLAPGGTHLMMMRPQPLAAGDTATIRIELGDGSRREFALPVRRRDGARP